MPLLFQRVVGLENRPISADGIRHLLTGALAASGITGTDGKPLTFWPHDFRRVFTTDAILNGMPPHIAQLILGHDDINTTMGYKAVYPEEAIRGHRAFIAQRRAARPSEEYRTPTDAEWDEFLGHFQRRRVALGDCGRAYSTPCIHEHSCFSELTVLVLFVRFLIWIWKPGGMGDSADDEARVAAVDAGQGVVEADRGSAGDAGGQEEHPPFPAAGGELAGVQGGDGGFPVDAGEQGDAVADAGADRDEAAGEVLAVQPAAAVDEQAGAGFEGMDAAGAGAQRVAEPAGVQGGHGCPSGPADGAAGDVGERGHAEVDGLLPALQGRVDLGELVLGAGEADLEALDLAEPAFALGLGDAVVQVVPDLLEPARWAGSGLKSEHLTHACSWTQGDANARAHVPTETFRFSKWARKASHSSSVGVRYSSLGRVARRRAMNARWASIASAG